MNKDIEKLLKLQFNIASKGFDYWIYAIELYRKNKNKYFNSMEDIYIDIANNFSSTRTRVERAMRTARKYAKEKIKEKYNYNNKITNKTVLELLIIEEE